MSSRNRFFYYIWLATLKEKKIIGNWNFWIGVCACSPLNVIMATIFNISFSQTKIQNTGKIQGNILLNG